MTRSGKRVEHVTAAPNCHLAGAKQDDSQVCEPCRQRALAALATARGGLLDPPKPVTAPRCSALDHGIVIEWRCTRPRGHRGRHVSAVTPATTPDAPDAITHSSWGSFVSHAWPAAS